MTTDETERLVAEVQKVMPDRPYPSNITRWWRDYADWWRDACAKLVEQRDEALREADRLRHGNTIEGDFICPNELKLVAVQARLEAGERLAKFVALNDLGEEAEGLVAAFDAAKEQPCD